MNIGIVTTSNAAIKQACTNSDATCPHMKIRLDFLRYVCVPGNGISESTVTLSFSETVNLFFQSGCSILHSHRCTKVPISPTLVIFLVLLNYCHSSVSGVVSHSYNK